MTSAETRPYDAIEQPWRLPYRDVADALATAEDGLTTAEATIRLARDGLNELGEQRSVSAAEVLIRQFRGPLIYLLLIAAFVTLLLGEYVDAAAITVVLVFNAAIGLVQEYRAERSMEALNRLAAARATVLRDGHELEIDAREVVAGDLLLLEAGSRVPADLRIGRAAALEADESLITGESTPAAKVDGPLDEELPVADRANMLFSGTTVTRGRCRGVVTATGQLTQLGQIAGRVGETARGETPLQRQMAQLGRVIGLLVLGIGTVGIAAGAIAGEPLDELFFTLVALAVSAIPEGLPVVFTITLAVGMRRMAARNVIIRRLPAFETLGSCDVIGSDKTGTLTENRMTVRRLYAGGVEHEVSGIGYTTQGEVLPVDASTPASDEALRCALAAAALCNEASIVARDGEFEVRGDPTEVALLVAAAKAGLHRSDLELATPRFGEIPFDAELRFAATFHRGESGTVVYVKGAPERVIEMCSRAEGMEELDAQALLGEADRMAAGGLRVLATAQAQLQTDEPSEGALHDLTFLGLAGMMDPPRAESADSVREVHLAGVRVVMVTGDHVATATAIARDLGIAGPTSGAVTGPEFEAMSDEELEGRLDSVAVYARVAPEHKLRLVRAFQHRGHTVAMTGDGVNDAPALKAADIGVAMGRGGTDVAREAAVMVIEYDNFSSIVAGV
jgi:Ca2+-transporting ATPase